MRDETRARMRSRLKKLNSPCSIGADDSRPRVDPQIRIAL